MRALAIVFVALALLAGCSAPRSIELGPEWRPLVRVTEAGDRVIPDRGQTTAIAPLVLVADLDDWTARHPEGSVERRALLLHEQEHARRQLAYPLERGAMAGWLARYVADAAFRWGEEQHGWALELAEHVRAGRSVDVEDVALALSGNYEHLGAPMVSLEEARVWVAKVLATARAGCPDGRDGEGPDHCGCRADRGRCEVGKPEKCGGCCSILPCPQESCR